MPIANTKRTIVVAARRVLPRCQRLGAMSSIGNILRGSQRKLRSGAASEHGLRAWTVGAAEDFTGPAHTWIQSWAFDRDDLEREVIAAGWKCLRIEREDQLSVLEELVALAETRRGRVSGQRVLVQIGPAIPWVADLRWLAAIGRAVGIHLAISDNYHLDVPRPFNSCADIQGWFPGDGTPAVDVAQWALWASRWASREVCTSPLISMSNPEKAARAAETPSDT